MSLVCILGEKLGTVLCTLEKKDSCDLDGLKCKVVVGNALKETLQQYPGNFFINLEPRYIVL